MTLLGGQAVVIEVSWVLPSAQKVCPWPGVQLSVFGGDRVPGSAFGGAARW